MFWYFDVMKRIGLKYMKMRRWNQCWILSHHKAAFHRWSICFRSFIELADLERCAKNYMKIFQSATSHKKTNCPCIVLSWSTAPPGGILAHVHAVLWKLVFPNITLILQLLNKSDDKTTICPIYSPIFGCNLPACYMLSRKSPCLLLIIWHHRSSII